MYLVSYVFVLDMLIYEVCEYLLGFIKQRSKSHEIYYGL